VAKNYIDLRGLQRRLSVTQANLAAQRETFGLTKVRFDAGLANDFEVAQSEGLVNTTEAQIPPLESALKQTAYRLDLLLGAQAGTLWSELASEVPVPALPPEAHVGMPAELLRRRPDIRRSERQLAAATAQVGAATADLYPKFSLTGSFGLQSISASDWFTARSRFWSIGPTISWPVFDAGRIRANIEIRNAQQEQALKLYEKSVLTALGDVEGALVNYSKEQTRYRSLLAAVAANRRAAQMANDLYVQGLVPFLDVLDAQRTVYASESDLVLSEANMASNLVALYKALGGGWETN
jgi:NodT family efflux transporter outer membrane factor (OMF) lipoprotein